MLTGRKDPPTVTPAGERLASLIDGVKLRAGVTLLDERGEICELYDPAWNFTPEPLVYVYAVSLRPGRVKGWVYHRLQTDRMFALLGALKVVLYDLRDDSPTRGLVNEIHVGERNRGLLRIPPMVAHAVQNVGSADGVFINMPDRPYNHSDPDKYRLPPDQIPYEFDRGSGW